MQFLELKSTGWSKRVKGIKIAAKTPVQFVI